LRNAITQSNTNPAAASRLTARISPAKLPPPSYVVTTAQDVTDQTPDCASGTGNTCSLRDALAAANTTGAGSITFSPTTFVASNTAVQNTIQLSSGLTIAANITITGITTGSGSTLTNLVTVSGGGPSSDFSIFAVTSSATAAGISNLNIVNGNANTTCITGFCLHSATAQNLGSGGGIVNGGTLTVTNSTFSGNSARYVGGSIASNGSLTVVSSTFSGNAANLANGDVGFGGGAIYSFSGTLNVTDSSFVRNQAQSAGANGGAIFTDFRFNTAATITNNTFYNNLAVGPRGWGGAIAHGAGPMTVANSVFSGNTATLASPAGAAIYNDSASLDSGYTQGSGTLNSDHNVFFNNLDTVTNTEDDCYNCTTNTNSVSGDPALAPLGNYGGPTQTMIPLPGSSAICTGSVSLAVDGNGNPLSADQRGWPMSPSACPSGAVDAGAVQSNYLTVNTLLDTLNNDAASCTDGLGNTCSLRDALTQANTAGMADVGFAPSLFLTGSPAVATPGTIVLGAVSGAPPAGTTVSDTGLPPITGTLNLMGPGATLLTVSGRNDPSVGSVFSLNSSASANLFSMTIADGLALGGGGINSSAASLAVTSCAISGNTAYDFAGGLSVNSGTATVFGSTITGNLTRQGSGGGISNLGALSLIDTTIAGNTVLFEAGGILNSGSLSIADSVVAGNSAGGNVGGISNSGTWSAANSIVAGNTSAGVANSGDCYGCGTQTAPNLIGLPSGVTNISQILGSLAYSPANATVQTMMPLPDPAGTLGIVCQGASAQLPLGVTTDERGFPMNPSCPAGAIDLGAVQTNYTALQFVQQPTNTLVNQPISPAPTVELVETNANTGATYGVSGIPVTLTITNDPTYQLLAGQATETTAPVQTANGLVPMATFGGLSVNTPNTGYTFTVTTPELSGASLQSAAFNIDAATVSQLAFTVPPASTVTAGIAQTAVTVQEESYSGLPLTGSGDSITLTVTGPNGYSHAYPQQTAQNGVATFSPNLLTLAGQYTYTASLSSPSAVTPATASQTVVASTVGLSLAVSGYPSPWYQGVPATATVSAVDQYGNQATSLNGSATVTTSDKAASVASPITLTNGVGTTTVTFATVGTQSITASAAGLTSGSETGIAVQAVSSFVVNSSADPGYGTAGNCPANTASSGPGSCTLRDALAAAANAGAGSITFDSTVFATAATIQLYNGLTIPGYTSITGPTPALVAGVTTPVVTVAGGGPSSYFPIFTVNTGVTGTAIANLAIVNGNYYYGGGILNYGALAVTKSTFSNSSSWDYGGAIYNSGRLVLNDSTFTGSTAGWAGGAIYSTGDLTAIGCAFSGNSATYEGGAIFSYNSSTLEHSTFTGNSTTYYGGALYSNGFQSIATSTFSTNTTGYGGGAIYNYGFGTVANSTFSGNAVSGQSYGSGGAIYSEDSVLQVSASTFAGNSATGTNTGIGGALYSNTNSLTFADNTVSGNFASSYGGGVYNAVWNPQYPTLLLTNSILSGNWLGSSSTVGAYDDFDDDSTIPVFSTSNANGGGNLLGYYNSLQAQAPPALGLAPLANYGGPTQTMIPLPGSPAICAGLASLLPAGMNTDQRGRPNTTVYPGFNGGTTCVDSGSVQTNYALAFSTQPTPIAPATVILPAASFRAAVTLNESGAPFPASVTLPLTLNGPGVLTGGSAATAGSVANYTLAVSLPGPSDTLAVSLPLNSALTQAPGLVVSALSLPFNVGDSSTKLSAANASTAYGAQSQNLTLSASVTSTAGSVNEGAILFTVLQGSAVVGTAVSGPVTNGGASASYSLPGGTPVGSYTINAVYSDAAGNFSGSADSSHTLTVNQATATVTLHSLTQTYTGSPLAATATTTPSGLTVNITYNGSAIAPTAVGYYAVAATINDPNYQGTASGTLVIGKATATVTLARLTQTYTGSPLSATATTTPANLNVIVTYNGSTTAPTAAGSYAVVATINDPNYQGTASGSLVIAQAKATVTLAGLTQTYTGSPLSATATTTPAKLAVTITYNGSATAPTAAGSYAVVATINNPNYQGSSSGVLDIAQAKATVTLAGLTQTYTGSPLSATATTMPAKLAVTIAYNGSATPPTAAGSYAVVATINDLNYKGTASGSLVIAQAKATVTLAGLTQTYTGSPLAATATTTPAGLKVTFTYNGSSSIPIAVGSYAVVGTVDNSNYQGTAKGTLTIGKATATITLGGLKQTYTGSPIAASVTTSPSDLNVLLTYNGSSAAPTAVGSYTVAGTISDTNYKGSASGTMVIGKASALMLLGNLSQTYTGSPLAATATTSPAGLKVIFTYNGSSTAPTTVGSYSVIGTINNADYQGSASGTLVIGKATLNALANNATKVYGKANPTFSGAVKGALGSDTFSETFATSATSSSNAGTYAIVPSVTGKNIGDYQVSVSDGTLTVTQASTTTTLAVSKGSITPGQSVSFTAKVTSPNGTPTGTVRFYDNGSLLNTATLSGSSATYSTASLAPGIDHTITATFSGDTNFTTSTSAVTTTVAVAPLDFTLAASGSTSQTVAPGATVTFTLQVTPDYGSYAGPVSISATGLPAGATVDISPSSIAANAGPKTVGLTIKTSAATAAEQSPSSPAARKGLGAFALAVLVFFGTGAIRRRGRALRGMLCVALLLASSAAALLLSGCCNNGFNTQSAKDYTITVTASSGTIQHATTFTINLE
jgi:hypothetical protein